MADVDACIAVVVMRVRWNQADGISPAVAVRGPIAQIVRPSVVDIKLETTGESAGGDSLEAVVVVGCTTALICDRAHVRQRSRRQKRRRRLRSCGSVVGIRPVWVRKVDGRDEKGVPAQFANASES